jgi:hypothetical protein
LTSSCFLIAASAALISSFTSARAAVAALRRSAFSLSTADLRAVRYA